MTNPAYPQRLQEIVDDFNSASREEKLELLLDYSDRLPPLPERLQGDRGGMEQVHECATPLFMHAERDDGMRFFFDIPPESPTVRGYAGLLRDGVDGAPPEAILQIPEDLADRLGLGVVLTPQRLNGVYYLLARMKRAAAHHLLDQPPHAA